MYKRILLPTDGTELCERAIRHGIALAKLADAQVIAQRRAAQYDPERYRRHHPQRDSQTCRRKLAVVERLAREAGVQVETLRQSNDHPWEPLSTRPRTRTAT
ncbi:MAG: universal stress protein [Hyphomicrobiaceae bacterium]